MATVQYGGREAFAYDAYQPPHPNTYAFMETFNQSFDNFIAPAARAFFDVAGKVYDTVDQSVAMRTARAFGRKMGSIWQENEIRELRTMGDFQQAPECMRRWLMAEEHTRKLYHGQRCDGYSGKYVDAQPGVIGEDHYEFRRVTNGMFITDADGNDTATTYFDEPYDPSDELDYAQQCDILNSWAHQRRHMLAKLEDPTSMLNASL